MEQEMALRDNYHDVDMEQIERRRQEADEEEEMVRKAIAESEALHQQRPQTESPDERMVVENESDEAASGPRHVATESRPDSVRVYDDEDAELQAALRASLEDTPEGYQLPDSPPPRMLPPPRRVTDSAQIEQTPASVVTATELSEIDTGDSEVGSETSSIASPEEEQISMEEMRKRRLAKFGL